MKYIGRLLFIYNSIHNLCILDFVSPKVGVINHVVGLKFIQTRSVERVRIDGPVRRTVRLLDGLVRTGR